jgi:hypothetical protein
VARFTPRNRLPASPRKIEAGWTLKTRNPALAPSRLARYRSVHRRPGQQTDAGDERDAAAETVHVVEQVERVRNADDPEEREHGVGDRRLGPVEPIAEEQEERRDRDLRDELG